MANFFIENVVKYDSSIQRRIVDFNTKQQIHSKGIYQLDDQSYFILIPAYTSIEENATLIEAIKNLQFTQHKSKDGTKVLRSTHYTGPRYSYGNKLHVSNTTWQDDLLKCKATLEHSFLKPINSLLVNQYSDGQYIPYHKDDELCLGEQPVIFSLSLGEQGIMTVKKQTSPTDKIQISLEQGTLLIMLGNFNKDYLHSVNRPSSERFRWNLTFRQILDSPPISTNDPSESTDASSFKDFKDLVISEISALKNQIKELTSLLQSKNQEITRLKSQISDKRQSTNKIAILKCELESKTPTKEDYVNLINKNLKDDKIKVQSEDILSYSDHRSNKGPILLEFKSLSQKVRVSTNIKKSDNFIAKDCLSQIALSLRKRALKLKNLGTFSKVWDYRGDIYVQLSDEDTRHRATHRFLKPLEGPGQVSKPEG